MYRQKQVKRTNTKKQTKPIHSGTEILNTVGFYFWYASNCAFSVLK